MDAQPDSSQRSASEKGVKWQNSEPEAMTGVDAEGLKADIGIPRLVRLTLPSSRDSGTNVTLNVPFAVR